MANKKILVNLWDNLAEALKQRTTKACLKRDPYLDHILRHEADRLEEEIPGRNSDRARDYILQELNTLPRKPVNLLLSEATIQRVNEVCERQNVPRDAFLHRVLLLLLMGPKTIEKIIPMDWKRARDHLLEQGPDALYALLVPSTLTLMADLVTRDPFWYARACIEIAREEERDLPPLHAAHITKLELHPAVPNAIGFNCYLPDELVVGTPENLQRQQEVDKLLAAMWEGE